MVSNNSTNEGAGQVEPRGESSGLVSRRVLVQGAAWSVPVIALAIATPAAAASTDATLQFTTTAYTSAVCAPMSGGTVTRTSTTVGVNTTPITVTLSDGYTFAGGSTTVTGVPADGILALPVITGPGGTSSAVFTAISGTLTAYATASTGSSFRWTAGTDTESYFGEIPPNSTPLAGYYNLSGTSLYYRNTLISTSVAAAVGYVTGDDYDVYKATVVFTDGTAGSYTRSTLTQFASVPLNSTPLAGRYFLAGTSLYHGNTLVSAAVRAAVGSGQYDGNDSDDDDFATVMMTNGAARLVDNNALSTTYASVPATATPVSHRAFLDGTSLYSSNQLVATDVRSIAPTLTPSIAVWGLRGPVGATWIFSSADPDVSPSPVRYPADARAVGYRSVLSNSQLTAPSKQTISRVESAIVWSTGALVRNEGSVVMENTCPIQNWIPYNNV